MKYMGSKSRIVGEISPIIQSYVDSSEKRFYYEPFCGGCNVIDHITADRRFAADKQKYLIALYRNLDKVCLLPEFITKDHYSDVRTCFNTGNNKYEDWYIGAVGFLASYNGRFFDGGYAGLVNTKAGVQRNYYAEAKRNLEAQIPQLQGISFGCLDYKDTKNITGYVIYCDPPYFGTKQYGASKDFNHKEFWKWVRKMSANNVVLVSEHNAPNDFECIWAQKILRTIDNNKRVETTEKLFMFSPNR